MGAGTETPQEVTDGSGKHAHNGEILEWLKPETVNSERILSAYNAYLRSGETHGLQYTLAKAYNRPDLTKFIHTPETVAVQRILDHRDETWIRHGIEYPKHMDYNNHDQIFPPPHTRHNVGEQVKKHKNLNRYAIDLDRWPFVTCSEHILDQKTGAPWAFTAGYLPLSVFKKYRGVLHHANDRDHLYASSKIPALEFTHFIWDFKRRVSRIHEQHAAQIKLLHSGLPVVHIRIVRKLHQLTTLLDCYADALPLALR